MTDFDEEFEFECPKFYDFESDPPDDEAFAPGYILDESWFERDHPLHEPKNPVPVEEALKPLIDLNEINLPPRKALPSKASHESRYKNMKKSLGVKPSVRLKRGDHAPNGQQKTAVQAALQRNKSLGAKTRKETTSKNSFGEDFHSSPSRDFNSPWGAACGTPTRAGAPYGIPASPLTTSQTRSVSSPASVPEPIRATLPEQHTSDQSASTSAPITSLFSPPLRSPRNALLAKQVGGAVSKVRPRRLLPKIPSQNPKEVVGQLIPVRGEKQPGSTNNISPENSYNDRTECPSQCSEVVSAPADLPLRASATTVRTDGDGSSVQEQCNESPMKHNNLDSQASQKKDIENTGKEQLNLDIKDQSVNDLLKHHNQRVRPKSCYDENGRRIVADSDTVKNSGKILTKTSLSDEIEITKGGMEPVELEKEEISVKDLLKHHNQRVKPKPLYDANGRRVRPATSTFCPAPCTKSDVGSKMTKATKSSRRSVSSATHTASSAKAAASSAVDSSKLATKTKQIEARQPPIKRSISTSDARASQRQKRRSCVIESTNPIPSLSKATAKPGAKQKRRSCVAAPQTTGKTGANLDRVDKDLMDLIARHNERLACNKT